MAVAPSPSGARWRHLEGGDIGVTDGSRYKIWKGTKAGAGEAEGKRGARIVWEIPVTVKRAARSTVPSRGRAAARERHQPTTALMPASSISLRVPHVALRAEERVAARGSSTMAAPTSNNS